MPTTQFEPLGRTPSPSQADVDDLIAQFGVSNTSEQQHARNLKAMVGLDPTPPPPEIARRLETREVDLPARESDVESLLAMGTDALSKPPAPARLPPARASAASIPDNNDERQLPTQPSSVKKMRASSASHAQMKPKRGSGLVVSLAVVAVAAGAAAVWELRPGAISGRPPPLPAPTTSVSAQVPSGCMATLIVADLPAHAEVLLRSGQAPIDVKDMPVGARLEFVATAEGYAPKRLVVPAGAGWDNGQDGRPRFEAAVQLDKSKAHPGMNEPWPAGEPGSQVGGQGPPGTVHVVATPRGAEIWMLVGMGPDARVDQLRCGEDFDVLVAGPTTFRKRLHVPAADFVDESKSNPSGSAKPKVPTRVARVSAK
jgi:hypothetical protein